MGTTDKFKESEFPAWLQAKLKEVGWTQKRLSDESGITQSNLSELARGIQSLTAEAAEKLAAVPELKTTAEELLVLAGAWSKIVDTSKRAKAIAMLDGLNDVELDLVMDFAAMLRQRERRARRNN